MKRIEQQFLKAVKKAVEDYDCSFEWYHEDDLFFVRVTLNDLEEWAENEEDIYEILSDVALEWSGNGVDDYGEQYLLAIES